jgi:hypothetical protein
LEGLTRRSCPFPLNRFEAAGIVPHYEVLYLVASDYAHMSGRAVHHFPEAAANGSLAIATESLIRSLRMTNENLDAGIGEEIDAIQAEYVAARPAGADRGEPA